MGGWLVAISEGDDRQARTTTTCIASRRIALVLSMVAALVTHTRTATAQPYQVIDLGHLGGGSAIAYDINASGQVVGQSLTDDGQFQGFIWLPSAAFGLEAGMYNLETLGGTYSEALGINAAGQVVGRAFLDGDTAYHAILWPTDGPVIDLGTLGGRNSQAYDISDSGEVVGWSDTAENQRHAFSWRDTNGNGVSDPGEMVDLGDLGGGQSIAYGINVLGQVVGSSTTASFASHAFRTTADGVIEAESDLGTLGGLSSTAYRINDAGMVAGHSQMPGNTTNHAFRTAANRPIDPDTDGLGTLGGTRSEAWGINAAGQAVGWSALSGSTARKAFLSSRNGMVDLNTLIDPALGWRLDAAFAINDGGQIVGSGGSTAGGSRAFLLRPQTPVGSNVSVSVPPALLTFESVLQPGQTQLSASSAGPPPPAGFRTGQPPTYFELTTSAVFAGRIQVCFDYSGLSFSQESTLRLFHFESVWIDVTTSLDTSADLICGITTSLSPFAIFEPDAVSDTTPPVLHLPGDIITNATGPSGATVEFTARATDDSGTVSVQCRPGFGAVFPIGTTLVSCTATDGSGNVDTGTFHVTVRGAAEQIVAMLERLRRMPMDPTTRARLLARMDEALAQPWSVVRVGTALRFFAALVRLGAGRSIPADLAALLLADTTRIRAVLGCS